MVPRQAAFTLSLVAGLLAAFVYATWLSYYGGISVTNAFAYQSAVVAAQRDAELLQVEQVEHHASLEALKPYQKLLATDLQRLDGIAESREQKAPAFAFPATNADYDRLTRELLTRETLGQQRFNDTVDKNTQTRDLSNAIFALVALLFVMFVGRLRRAVEEGRLLVQRLQRAFIARRRDMPGVDVGSVLLSATRGSNVGGDTHDAFTLDSKHGMFLVADVSGKGIDAAVDTALIKYSVRTLFSEETDPGIILAKFGRLYAASAESLESFVVMFLAVVDLETGTVRYASAGHEPAWAVVGQDVVQLATTGPIVGIEDAPTYDTRTLHLRYGDSLVISTDGLTESRDARGAFLGADAVTVWLSEMTGTAQRVADAIVKRLKKRSSQITDDLAILVVRFAPSVRPGMSSLTVDPERKLDDARV
ncbi:MAG: hypothetical protein NVS2B8_03980 [Vulcanimicrobiaceae bacterium]